MSANTRLNGIIRAFESGKPAHLAFAKLDKQSAIELSDSLSKSTVSPLVYPAW